MSKKNIRKFFVILCTMLLVFSLAACKGKENGEESEDKNKTENVKGDDDSKDDEKNAKGDDKDADTDNKGNNEDDNKDADTDNKGNNEDDNKGADTDNKGNNEDDNKDALIDNPDTTDGNKGSEDGNEDNKGNQSDPVVPGKITMQRSGKSSNGKISFVVDEDDYLLFAVDPSYGLTEDAMMFIVPKGEYVFYDEVDDVDLDYEFCEDEPDENGNAIFEFFIYNIEPGEYDMVLTTDYDGYVCAKWSIAIESNDVYEVDLSNLKEYDKPDGFVERPQYKDVAAGEWPTTEYSQPKGCEVLGGGENATGLIVYVKWNSKQDVLNYIEELEGQGIEAYIDLEDEESINWYANEVRVIYTADDSDEDIIMIL